MDSHQQNEKTRNIEGDHQQSMQKNQGLINTIMNNNKHLKNIHKKIFNSLYVKEISKKTTYIKKHLVDSPPPHKSSRELVLFVVTILIALGSMYIVGRKHCLPKFIHYLSKKSRKNSANTISISKQVDNQISLLNLKYCMENQNDEVQLILNKINKVSTPPDQD